jgi:hypothetical protein
MTTSWVRSRAPIFVRIRETCDFTVNGLMTKRSAISALVDPPAIRERISTSRAVRSSGSAVAAWPGSLAPPV